MAEGTVGEAVRRRPRGPARAGEGRAGVRLLPDRQVLAFPAINLGKFTHLRA